MPQHETICTTSNSKQHQQLVHRNSKNMLLAWRAHTDTIPNYGTNLGHLIRMHCDVMTVQESLLFRWLCHFLLSSCNQSRNRSCHEGPFFRPRPSPCHSHRSAPCANLCTCSCLSDAPPPTTSPLSKTGSTQAFACKSKLFISCVISKFLDYVCNHTWNHT